MGRVCNDICMQYFGCNFENMVLSSPTYVLADVIYIEKC